MQKNKSVYEVPLTKQEFVDILNRLREATELVDTVEELFRDSRENLECDFCNGAGLQISHEGIVVKLLERLVRNNAGNISYSIYELDYGKTYQEGCISDQSGNIDFSTPEKLYDYLMKEYSLKNGSDNNAEE